MSTQTELDQAAAFKRLQQILGGLYDEITRHLTVFPKTEQPFQTFASSDGGVQGSLLTFQGEQIDKLVLSHLNAPRMGFGTLRLTVWLRPHLQVPHLAFEFGTIPQPFFYMDYLPRVDLWTDLDYADQYYEALNATYLALRANPDLTLFVSKGLPIRQIQSPAHLCFTAPGAVETFALIETTAQDVCSRWLNWVAQASPVPPERQVALAERDLRMRQVSAERDPGNAMAAKIFGAEFASQLVQALWSREV
ncbi:MAG: hypothetical protein VKK04_06575 [Synechococcales bacterium]|nr:hypothetical protein [Synechococcales bacterium]